MKNNVINIVCDKMLKHSISQDIVDSIKAEIIVELKDYDINKKTTAIIPRTETADEMMYKRFFIVKRVEGCSERTLYNYHVTISNALKLIGKQYKDITTNDIRYLLAYKEVEENVQRISCNNIRRYLSSFFGFLTDEGYIEKNPVKDIKDYKITKKHKVAFTDMEIELMRNAIEEDDLKQRAIFETLLSTACRVSELVQIKISDIHNDKIIICGKGNKERELYLNAKAKLAINNYLESRENDDNDYLFPARKTKSLKEPKPMTTSAIEKSLKSLGKKSNVQSHPHKFRRTWATNALKSGMDLIYVSKILGHENVSITQTYLDLDNNELKLQHSKYSRG